MAKVLIIGSGGREHALGWKLGQSEDVSEVIYATGNAGTQEEKGRNVSVGLGGNFEQLHNFVINENIDLVVVGPEDPLANGVVDYFNSKGFSRIFGPTQKASLLESDKFFSYDLMHELGIPQAESVKCSSLGDALKSINEKTTEKGIVLKARGLTGGKGVSVCNSKEQAFLEIDNHIKKYGPEVLIAERLFGQEFSVFGISDGTKVSPLELSIQDHKPLLDGDRGPNTGGMGAYGPAPVASAKVVRDIAEKVLTPVVQKMKEQGKKYKGFIYAGMMMTAEGPKVLEFNIRFGDPEAQPAMMMLQGDLYHAISNGLEGKLNNSEIKIKPGAACCVVLASRGYPEAYKKGLAIKGIGYAEKLQGVKVFHAGTKIDNGALVTSGGRVLGVTAYSEHGIFEAKQLAYAAASVIDVEGGFHYRRDIADKALR